MSVDRLQVFISSAFWSLKYEREFLALVCERMGWEALEFPEQSSPGSAGRDYLRRLRSAHVLVYLVATQDSAATERELEVARELGIPVVPFARWTSGKNGRRRPKSVDDFVARTGAEFIQLFETLKELETGLIDGVSAVIAERVASANVSLEPYSERLYVHARDSLTVAERRYGVAQQTSSLVLGPNRGRLGVEDAWIADWRGALQASLSGESEMEMVHIFDVSSTLERLHSPHREEFPEAKTFISELRGLLPPLTGSDRVRVIARTQPTSPVLLADGALLIPANYEVSHYFQVGHALNAANQLWDILRRIAGEQADPIGELESFLDAAEALVS